LIHHDNAPADRALTVDQLVGRARKHVFAKEHTPYLTELSPIDSWFLQKLKFTLNERRFQDIKNIQENVTDL
jgi:hypothetical protein